MQLIAHRGDHTDAPENSMRAFQNAYRREMFGIEFDIRLTADRLPIVFHHMRIEHGELDGFVTDYTESQLTQHDFIWDRDQQPYRIPTLREVVDNFAGKLYLELHVQDVAPDTATQIAAILFDFRSAWSRMEITSYEPAIMLQFQDLCLGLATDLLFKPEPWMTVEMALTLMIDKGRLARARAVHLFAEAMTPDSISRVRSHGIDVHGAVVDDVETMQRLEALGIRQACSNNVRALRSGEENLPAP